MSRYFWPFLTPLPLPCHKLSHIADPLPSPRHVTLWKKNYTLYKTMIYVCIWSWHFLFNSPQKYFVINLFTNWTFTIYNVYNLQCLQRVQVTDVTLITTTLQIQCITYCNYVTITITITLHFCNTINSHITYISIITSTLQFNYIILQLQLYYINNYNYNYNYITITWQLH